MELLALIAILGLLGALAARFGADSRPAGTDRWTSDWNADQGHRA